VPGVEGGKGGRMEGVKRRTAGVQDAKDGTVWPLIEFFLA
jgi:hypothetical protein